VHHTKPQISRIWLRSGSTHPVGHLLLSQELQVMCFDLADDVQQAAKTLFDAGIVRLSDEESIALVDAWQHHRKLAHIYMI